MGDYNVDNLLGVIAALRALGVNFSRKPCRVQRTRLQAVPGRMEKVPSVKGTIQLPLTVVDYAHTPDAVIANLLAQFQADLPRRLRTLNCGACWAAVVIGMPANAP